MLLEYPGKKKPREARCLAGFLEVSGLLRNGFWWWVPELNPRPQCEVDSNILALRTSIRNDEHLRGHLARVT